MLVRQSLLHAIAAVALLGSVLAETPASRLIEPKKPPVPPGRDPGGVAVAIIGTGIDYTLPEVARRLARDGEGELIGWDLKDQDRRPFDTSKGTALPEWGGDSTLVASLLIGAPTVRLVPVRVKPGDPVGLARALAFVAQTPARVAVLAMWSNSPVRWEPFREAARRYNNVLVIVPAGQGAEPAYPGALGLDNVLAVAPGTARQAAGFGGATWRVAPAVAAVAAAGSAAAELLAREPALDAAALKRRLGEAGGADPWQAQR
jgi:hypothetical protein